MRFAVWCLYDIEGVQLDPSVTVNVRPEPSRRPLDVQESARRAAARRLARGSVCGGEAERLAVCARAQGIVELRAGKGAAIDVHANVAARGPPLRRGWRAIFRGLRARGVA